MRHAISFTTSVIIHIAVFISIILSADTKILPQPQSQLQTIDFEFGEIIAVHTGSQEPKKTIQQVTATPPSSEPETVEEQKAAAETPQSEAEVIEVEKVTPKPIVKKTVVSKKVTKPKKPKKKIVKKKPKQKAKKIVKKKKKPKQPPKKKKIKKQITKKQSNPTQKRLTSSNISSRTVKSEAISNSTVTSSHVANTVNGKRANGIQSRQSSSGASVKGTKKANAGNSTSFNAYKKSLSRAIGRIAKRNYPRKAKRMRKEGIVRVRFHISSNGNITQVSIIGSSGNSALDKAAIKAVKRLGRYKAPPAGFPNIQTIPIRFTLR